MQAQLLRKERDTAGQNGLGLFLLLLIAAAPVLMAILPWDFGPDLPPARTFLLAYSIPILVVELAVILFAFRNQFSPFSAIAALPIWAKVGLIVLLLIAAATTFLVAHIVVQSFLSGLTWMIHLLFAFSVVYLAKRKILTVNAQTWFVLSLGVAAYAAMLAIFIWFTPNRDLYRWEGMLPGLPFVRHIGPYALTGFLAAFALAGISLHRSRYWLGVLLGSIGIGLGIWSGTRGALFAIIVAMLLAFIAFPSLRNRQILRWLILTCLGGTSLSLAYIPPASSFGLFRVITASQQTDPGRLSSGRTALWAATAQKVAERPWFGYGERQFNYVVLHQQQGLIQPHNVLLQIALQWGLVGAACFFSMVAMLCAAFYRKAIRIGEEAIPAFLIVTAILVYSLYDAALFYPYPIMMAVFCIAAILGRPDEDASPLPANHRD